MLRSGVSDRDLDRESLSSLRRAELVSFSVLGDREERLSRDRLLERGELRCSTDLLPERELRLDLLSAGLLERDDRLFSAGLFEREDLFSNGLLEREYFLSEGLFEREDLFSVGLLERDDLFSVGLFERDDLFSIGLLERESFLFSPGLLERE